MGVADVLEPTDGVASVGGIPFVVPSAERSNVSKRILTTGRTEPLFTRMVQRLVRPGAHVADVGANIGYFTRVMAVAAGPTGRVWSFEPVAQPRRYLAHNVALNGFTGVHVDPRALADFNGPGYLTLPAYRLKRDLTGKEKIAFEVEVGRLDDVAPELGIDRLDLLKIDIEGAELRALEGMRGCLERWRPLLAIEVHPGFLPIYEDSLEALHRFLGALGYDAVRVEPPGPGDENYHIVAGPPEALRAERLAPTGEGSERFALGDGRELGRHRRSAVTSRQADGALELEFDLGADGREYLLTAEHVLETPPRDAARFPLDGDRYTEIAWSAELDPETMCSAWLLEYDDRALVLRTSFRVMPGRHVVRHVTDPNTRAYRLGLRVAGSGKVRLESLSLTQWPGR